MNDVYVALSNIVCLYTQVTLNDGRDVTLELKMFQSSTHDNFEKMCRTSRTAFLQWAKTQGLCVQVR